MNFKLVKGPPFLVFAKGMPSKMETCKRIFNDLPLSNLRPTDRESSKNDDVGHTYSHTCNYPFCSISYRFSLIWVGFLGLVFGG